MIVDPVIVTKIDDVKYAVEKCDEGLDTEHWEVIAVREDTAALAIANGGIGFVRLRFNSYEEANHVYAALVAVATLDRYR